MTLLVQRAITNHRRENQLSALALAREIDISSGQLAALERGEDTPSLFTLQKLAKYFRWGPLEIGKYVLECKAEPAGPKRLRTERR
jgi:transcriptional regulator with XRE-family HTH domain